MKKQILADIITARKEKQALRLETLQAVKAFVEQDSRDPSDKDYENGLRKVIKQYNETYASAITAKRQDMADIASQQIDMLEAYMPKQLTEPEVEILLTKVLRDNNLQPEKKNMGQVVKLTVAASNNTTDGKTVSTVFNRLLAVTDAA